MNGHPAKRTGDTTAGSDRPTIFALASGAPPAGVAVVRVSGPACRFAVETIAGPVPPPRGAVLRSFRRPGDGAPIDRGLVLFFPGPGSFTGEDVAEFHLHGGRAVVAALLDALARLPGLEPAEAGAFTRRAFENGRMDLTAVEGLADLIAAETELQRRQALRLADGALTRRAEDWREALLRARAAVEADLDFADEEDVPGSVADTALEEAARLCREIRAVLDDEGRGERIRDGFQVVLAGAPNAGKSSLLNALARREAAIVTAVPGTTRDVVEVRLDLDGAAVILADTAGIRETVDLVEVEGVRRATARAAAADLVLWLSESGEAPPADLAGEGGPEVVAIRSKADLVAGDGDSLRTRSDNVGAAFPAAISVLTGEGLEALERALGQRAGAGTGGEPPLVTRVRHRRALERMLSDLDLVRDDVPMEIRAEALRGASESLGRLTGRIDVEEVLGAIFSSLCIGK